MVLVGQDGTTKQMEMTMYRYFIEQHCNSYKHKTWRVVRRYDNCIMCVCVYKRGAYRVCDELNALASGKMGASGAEDMYVS